MKEDGKKKALNLEQLSDVNGGNILEDVVEIFEDVAGNMFDIFEDKKEKKISKTEFKAPLKAGSEKNV